MYLSFSIIMAMGNKKIQVLIEALQLSVRASGLIGEEYSTSWAIHTLSDINKGINFSGTLKCYLLVMLLDNLCYIGCEISLKSSAPGIDEF